LAATKLFNVGMIAAQRRHHGAAPGTRRQDGPTHGFPDLHKGHRTGGNGSGAFRQRATGPQGREIQSDAAALLHRDRASCKALKMPGIESSIGPITKQLKSVTFRAVPAPA
jgi:hypothetical protein